MSIKTITIKDLEQRYIGIAKDCHLCGEQFTIGMHSSDTICPKCKELWKEFVENRGITLNVKINKRRGVKEK